MQQREMIHQYLKALSKYLARLDKQDADEVIREIESHIFDAIEVQEQSDKPIDAEKILQGFGEPRLLAQQYVEHLLAGAPPPKGFKAIQRVRQGVTTSLYFSMAVFGFSIAFALMFLAFAKLFVPDSIGVWSAAHGESVAIGFLWAPFPQDQELLGMWLTPLALILSLLIAELTRRVLRILKAAM